jgi:hypothetical protein
MCAPWQGEQFLAKIAAPAAICFGETFWGLDFCADAVAHVHAKTNPTAAMRFIQLSP